MAMNYGSEDKNYPNTDFGTVEEWVDNAIGSRGTWEQDLIKWYKLRTRVKKEKTYPFPNCSNIRMPTLDIKIKKLKSQIRNGVLGIRPVVQVIPSPSGNAEVAAKIEKLIDHLTMDVANYEQKFIITVDQALETGFYLNKPYWKLEIIDRQYQFDIADIPLDKLELILDLKTKKEDIIDYLASSFSIDKHKYVWADNHRSLGRLVDRILSGKFKSKFRTKDVVYSFPDVALIHPEKCYVRNDGGYHPQDQSYIVDEIWMSRPELESMQLNQDWDISGITSVIDTSDIASDLETVKAAKEGIDSFRKCGKVKIYEAQGYIGGEKKLVITAPDFNTTLKNQPLPMPSGKYNIVKFFHELRDNRWYHHRGLPEILEDLVKEIDVQHMQKIDRQTIVNSPMFAYRAGAINQQTVQFTFGQGIPVNSMNSISEVFQPINSYNQAADFSYDREQQVLKADIDEYTGQIDFTLSQQLNRREPRTAEEVTAQSNASAMVTSLDLSIFRKSFEELVNMIWELWCEYGEDEYEFKYFGDTLQESVKLNKEEIQGKYLIKVRANDDNVNVQSRIAKAQSIIQAVSNPVAMQTGIVTPQNIAEAYKRYFIALGVDQAESLYNIPQPQEPGVPDKTFPKFEDLTELEQSQVLNKLGIKPDVGGRIQDKFREVQNERSDNLVNIANSMK